MAQRREVIGGGKNIERSTVGGEKNFNDIVKGRGEDIWWRNK